jgi:hypothetical protein
VIDLPRHLSPWVSHLALFPKEMALALGAVVSRLSNIIGSGQVTPATEGAPDGYDGIASRGSYDRLLPIEWLLLDEIPDEFLRRVISGEHSFLQRAHTQGAAGRRCLALFDAGAEQLGAPRIAHLAVLILLARRAEQQGATLEWGVLQDPSSRLHAAVTKATVLELLRGRCVRDVSSDDLDRWITAAQGSRVSELWFVGAEKVAREATRHRASIVTVSDVLEPGAPQRIRVTAASPRLDRVRKTVLDVPVDRLAVQLLRDPFSAAVASRLVTAAQLDVRSNLVFAPDGRRLYVRGANSTLVAFQVPNSPRATPGPPVAFAAPEGHTIVGVGRSSSIKRAIVLSQRGPEAFVHVLSKRGASITRSERFTSVEGYTLPPVVHGSTTLRPLGVLEQGRICFISIEGDLIELWDGKINLKDKASALASRALRDGLAWASLHFGVPQIMWARTTRTAELEISPSTTLPELPSIYGAHSFRFGGGLCYLFAYATSPSSWTIVHQRLPIAVGVADRFTVVGVVERGHSPSEVCLVALDETETRLDLLLPGRSETLLTTATPIASVEVSGTGREIAFLTQAAEVGVYSCLSNAVIMRSAGGAAP